jgi:hypothetical protein
MSEPVNNYADIEKLMAGQNSLLEQQQAKQNEILDQQLQMQQDVVNRNKAEIDQNANKTNSGLYAEWKKASNRYGPNAENLYTQGLGNSGFAESTQTNLYNTYQKNITDTNNTAMKLKADFDFQMQQARQNRDVQQAQYALELYQQKMNLLTQEYDLKNQKEQQIYQRGIDERNYNYQVERDKVSDNQWEKEYQRMLQQAEAQERWNQKNFDYQVERDKIADNQWEREFALSQMAKASSGRSGGSSSSKSSGNSVNLDTNNSSKSSSVLGQIKTDFQDAVAYSIYSKAKQSGASEEEARAKANAYLSKK